MGENQHDVDPKMLPESISRPAEPHVAQPPYPVKASPPTRPLSLFRGFSQPIWYFFQSWQFCLWGLWLPSCTKWPSCFWALLILNGRGSLQVRIWTTQSMRAAGKDSSVPGGKLVSIWTTLCWEASALLRCPKSICPLLAATPPQPCQQRHLAGTSLMGLASSLAQTRPKWHMLNEPKYCLKAQLCPDQGFCWHC